MSNVFILNDEKQIGTLSVGRAVGGELGKIVENSFKIKGGVSEALNLVLVHKTNDCVSAIPARLRCAVPQLFFAAVIRAGM